MKRFTRQPLSAAVMAITVAGGLGAATQVDAFAIPSANTFAGYTEVTTDNPFSAITSSGGHPSLVMMDLDADGDLDAVLFSESQTDPYPYNYGGTSVWENTGSKSAPTFTEVRDTNAYASGYGTGVNISLNPFANSYSSYYGHPVSAFDVSGDGVPDFIGGQHQCADYNNQAHYAEVQTDGYGVVTGATEYDDIYSGLGSNPFFNSQLAPSAADNGYAFGCNYGYASFAAGDLDNDTDVDIVSTDQTELRVFMNDGEDSGYGFYLFNEVTGSSSPVYGISLTSPYYGAPVALHDVDGDKDLDLIIGTNSAAKMRLFINDGSASTAHFTEVTAPEDFDVTTKGWAAPAFADVDGDGDDDFLLVELDAGNSNAQSIRLFTNNTSHDSNNSSSGGGGSLGLGLLASLGLLFRRRRR